MMEVAGPSQTDVLSTLRVFLSGAMRSRNTCDLDLTKTALVLLKTVPASRDGVLEYLSMVFDYSVKRYAQMAQNDQLVNAPTPVSQTEEQVLSEIHAVLGGFLLASPQAWAPIISSWSLQLLGRLSSRYSPPPGSAGLNETLHWWMTCKAARTLIDLTTQCFQCLIDTNTEACVSSLLDTSVAHSPLFDWVVALVGSCFSQTVITRILLLGLKDYSIKGSDRMAKQAKMKSVVGILGHLGVGHFSDVRSALLALFKNPSEPAVVPYLLHLATHSQTLLNALAADVLHELDVSVLKKMADGAPIWASYLLDSDDPLEDQIVSLAIRCERGATKIISLLLDGSATDRQDVAVTCQVLTELLLEKMDVQLRTQKATTIPFLDSLKTEIAQIHGMLLTDNVLRQRVLCRLLRLLEIVHPSVVIEIVSNLLKLGSHPIHLSTLLMVVSTHSGGKGDILTFALEHALREKPPPLLWLNLCSLLKFEKDCKGLVKGPVVTAIAENLLPLSAILASRDKSLPKNLIIELLELVPAQSYSPLPLQLALKLSMSVVRIFFECIQEPVGTEKIIHCDRVATILARFSCDSASARASIIRELLESALLHTNSHLFGSRRRPIKRLVDTPYSLIEENNKSIMRNSLSGRQSSAFSNTVVIPSTSPHSLKLSPEIIEENMYLLLNTLRNCCLVPSPTVQGERIIYLEATIQVALLLVELISPDVMYNGLPWPEEDFCKVTIERDIHIRKVFDEVPVAWRVLGLLARHQPSLCYCSVLLRALMASVISQWSSPATSSQPSLLSTTVRLLRLMCLGQLLPPPLTSLHQVLPLVTPQEVLALLRGCVWNYMRDHVPSPALFSADPRSGFMWRDTAVGRPPLCYTEPLRLVLLNNIHNFGELYQNLFAKIG